MAAGLSFANIGAQQAPITVTPPTSTGLEAVYVVQQFTPQITVSYEATGTAAASTAKWYRFSSLGGGFAEELTSTSTGNKSTVQLGLDSSIANSTGMGYIVEYDGLRPMNRSATALPYCLTVPPIVLSTTTLMARHKRCRAK
jgi:hypothetical protein